MGDTVLIWTLIFGFTLFKIVWVVTDTRTIKERIREAISFRIVIYSIVTFALFAPLVTGQPFLRWPATAVDGIFVSLGLVIFWLGLLLAFWAKLVMKDSWGVPAQHQILRQTTLVVSGPFKISRNPIYVGLMLAMFGTFLALRSYLIFTIVIWFYYVYKAVIKEEWLLEKHFGEKYLEYKNKVNRFLFI